MKRAAESASSALGIAGKGIRDELRRIYGSPEEAERAVEEAMKDPRAIEQWARVVQTKQQRLERNRPNFYFVPGVDLRSDEEWALDAIPKPMREAALWSMAAAMLVWSAKEESGAA